MQNKHKWITTYRIALLKKLLKNILSYLLYYLKLYKFINLIRNTVKGPSFTIILYHSFAKEEGSILSVDAKVFEKHCIYLKNNFNVKPLDEIVQAVLKGEKMSAGPLG